MGVRLAIAAYAVAAADHFQDHRSMRLFTFMALTALDDSARPSFYGGEAALLDAIAGTDAKTMRRSLTKLRAAGYLERDDGPAHTGRRSVYYLMDGSGAPLSPVDRSSKAGQIAPAQPSKRRGNPSREAGQIAPERRGRSPHPRRKRRKRKRRARALPPAAAPVTAAGQPASVADHARPTASQTKRGDPNSAQRP